jgi:hypothetical protein
MCATVWCAIALHGVPRLPHRNRRGILDVEPPPNNPESVMTVEEIFANDLALHSTAVDQEEEEVDRKHAGGGEQEHIMRLVLSDLPPVVLR